MRRSKAAGGGYRQSEEVPTSRSNCSDGGRTYRSAITELKRLNNMQQLFSGRTVQENAGAVMCSILNIEGENDCRD